MRSTEQNALFHVWCRAIADWLTVQGAPTSEEMVKALVKWHFGPGKPATFKRGGLEVTAKKPSHKWTTTEMTECLASMEAWAATDLGGLELKSINEETYADWSKGLQDAKQVADEFGGKVIYAHVRT